MAYKITPQSATAFVTERIKMPRFQRKQTWDECKNFKLCISLFKNYPIGVCIEYKDDNKPSVTKEILDGRQRRNALLQMYQDPDHIYSWAVKFLGLKNSDKDEDIESKFEAKMREYFESDVEDDDEDENGGDVILESTEEEASVESLDADEQKDVEPFAHIQGLDFLLFVIKSFHDVRNGNTNYTRTFDLRKFCEDLPYIDRKRTNKKGDSLLSGYALKLFIADYCKDCDFQQVDYSDSVSFLNYFAARMKLAEKEKSALEKHLKSAWTKMLMMINILKRIDLLFDSTEIGIILVWDIDSSDTQKIFNIINSEGVKLTAVEILSAKKTWNIKVKNPSDELQKSVKELYKAMGIDVSDVARWDVPATLLPRLGTNVVFKDLSWKVDEKKAEFEKRLTLGFKTLSGIYSGGIKRENVESLATSKNINWDNGGEIEVEHLNKVLELIQGHSYFKHLMHWKTSIMELTSDAVALNFILIMYREWEKVGRPYSKSLKDVKPFRKNAFALWDKLIYEYVQRMWRGSSDSAIAQNISDFEKNHDEIFKPISSDLWKNLLDKIYSDLEVGSSKIWIDGMKPILYHMYCMKMIMPTISEYGFEVDHVIPQYKFKNALDLARGKKNAEVLQDSLYNLGLLPKGENISKSNKPLNEIRDKWLRNMVVQYEFIPEEDFEKYSSIDHYDEMFKIRKQIFDEAFGPVRSSLLND
ncbi:MAG: DUF262 domain-containing protein [Fibrobacter sp.]|nr:DUF262 domain-containing protein [Fibrobacter sp.]